MVRVLCLHGWAINSEVFTHQLRHIKQFFSPEVEFIVLEAPIEVHTQPDPAILSRFPGKYYAWFDPQVDASSVKYVGMDQSVDYVITHLRSNPPYDGVLGFSQGATFAALLLAMQNIGTVPSSFRFAVFFAPGVIPPTALLRWVPRGLPTAFIMGEQDVIMPLGYLLARCFLNPTVIIHNSGHRMPRLTPDIVKALRTVMFASDKRPRMSSGNMVRVLCLPGWGTNTEIFKYQIKHLQEKFREEVEFIVMPGAIEVPSSGDPTIQSRFSGPYLSWYSVKSSGSDTVFEGLATSLHYLQTHIENSPPYDGVLGFSQGGGLATLLLCLQNQGVFPGHFQFAILVCPTCTPSLALMEYMPRGIPTAFFMGEMDIFLPVGLLLARSFLRPIVRIHSSGHRFPKATQEVVDLLRSVIMRKASL